MTHKPILVYSSPTRVPNRLAQPHISYVNIYESLSVPSVKGMDPYESISAALHLPPEESINKLGNSTKVRKSRICKYLNEFMLDVIRAPEGGTQ